MNSNPPSKCAINKYVLPIHKSKLIRIDTESSPVHIGKLANAVDLLAPEETPVLAAADGIITFVNAGSVVGGPDILFWDYSNFIVIMHSNDEYSRYDHLAFGSSDVIVGQQVKAGQPIARIGMTGYTFTPHLHFQVFVFTGPNLWEDYQTLKVHFSDL
jgi:murein DD-endopeptidase MepM/ murein hydrolase activator NlpD